MPNPNAGRKKGSLNRVSLARAYEFAANGTNALQTMQRKMHFHENRANDAVAKLEALVAQPLSSDPVKRAWLKNECEEFEAKISLALDKADEAARGLAPYTFPHLSSVDFNGHMKNEDVTDAGKEAKTALELAADRVAAENPTDKDIRTAH